MAEVGRKPAAGSASKRVEKEKQVSCAERSHHDVVFVDWWLIEVSIQVAAAKEKRASSETPVKRSKSASSNSARNTAAADEKARAAAVAGEV